jgi:hypothetical protein
MSLTPIAPLAPIPSIPSIGAALPGASVANKILGAAIGGPAALLFGVSASRLIAIAVGLILVAAAVFSFKPVRETVVGVSEKAAKAAAVAA